MTTKNNSDGLYALQIKPQRKQESLAISLDIARGLAALFVFFFHMSGFITSASPKLGELAHYGHMGVPVFFVISGYCMAASAHQNIRNNLSAGSFLRKRFFRIYPTFWASILIIMVIPYILAGLSAIKTGNFITPTPSWMDLNTVDWIQITTLIRIFFSNGIGLDYTFSSVNIVYWTLAIEFQFYLVIYLALIWRKHFIIVISCVTVLSLSAFIFPHLKDTGLFLGYWPSFSLGLGLYFLLYKNYTLTHLVNVVHKKLIFLILLVALSLIFAYKSILIWFLEIFFIDDFFGFALCTSIAFWFLAHFDRQICLQETNGHLLVRLPLKAGRFLGSISYSVYLLHPKIYQFPEMVIRQMATPNNPIYIITITIGTIFLSWLFYIYFERPFINRRKIT